MPSIARRVARTVRRCLSIAAAIGIATPAVAAQGGLTVFAAASLTDALTAIGAEFERATGTKVAFHFGASSLLARQIEEGAPADLFVSADEAKVDALATQRLIDPTARKALLSNRLVIVVAAENGAEVAGAADLATSKVRVLALAEPQSVPAGLYARAYLRKVGLWDAVSDKVVPTENVRAALAAVESGNADAAIVYATDAAISRRVRVAAEVAAADVPRIVYVGAVLRDARGAAVGRRFLDYLASERASDVFRRAGFVVLEPASSQLRE